MNISGRRVLSFLASYGFSCILLLLLFILTYLGTLYQVEHGLYQAQQKYFASFFLIHHAFGVLPVPLPGGYLLMALFSVNLLLGGVVYARKGWSKLGILVAHAGILVLLAGSFITAEFSMNGYLRLYEGQQSDMFESYTEWELAVSETGADGPVTEYVIHDSRLKAAHSPQGVRFQLDESLPFQLHLWNYMPNAAPQRAAAAAGLTAVDGFVLAPAPNGDAERRIPGAYASLADIETGEQDAAIVWGGAEIPLVLEKAGRHWKIELRRRRWQLPFTVALTEFTRELHPGTQKPKSFRSDIVKIQQGVRQDAAITMNAPLREQSYTLYQSSWGPENAPPGTPLFSVFAVSRNPADKFPLYACVVVTIGLTFHFLIMLAHYLRRQAKIAARTAAAAIVGAAMLVSGGDAAAQTNAAHREWDAQTLRMLATLPVLDEGRMKPLDTYASLRLMRFNGRRSTKNIDGKRIGPTEWLADCMFRPELARQYKIFLIQDSDAALAVGIEPTRKRDRYSYDQIAPARERLIQTAREFSALPGQRRSPLQTQVMNLAHNMLEFELICGAFAFAQEELAVPDDPAVAKLFDGKTSVPLSGLLAKAPQVLEIVMQKEHEEPGSAGEAIHFLSNARDRIMTPASLRLLPPIWAEQTEWFTPEDVADAAFAVTPEQYRETLELFARLETAAANVDDPETFNAAIRSFNQEVTRIARERGEYGRIPLEVTLHRIRPFYYSLVLFVFCFALVMISWMLPRNRILYMAGVAAACAPTLLLAVGITMRSIIRSRPPVTNTYETILFATLAAVAIALFIELVNRRKTMLTLAAALGALGMFAALKYELRDGADTMPSMVAVLDTNFWLATHVTTITMGYGAAFLASALGHVYILARALGFKKRDRQFYKNQSQMIYGVLCFSLLFVMLGTVIGGIWANESWGRFWGWDPKENGALMIVLWQLLIIHARLGGYIRDHGIAMAAVFTGVVTAFAWFGVNLLGVGLHSYGSAAGTMNLLRTFYAIEAAVLIIGAAAWFKFAGKPGKQT